MPMLSELSSLMPDAALNAIKLPSPTPAPPMASVSAPLPTLMPWLELPTASAPVASVPM